MISFNLCLIFLSFIVSSQNQLINIIYDIDKPSMFNISNILESVGIEYINHEIYGFGLYAQMIFGESFEEVSGSITPSPGTAKTIELLSETNYNIRHCDFDLFITNINGNGNSPSQDFSWNLIQPGLTGLSDTISFESVNYPGYYISLIDDNSLENTRLGLVEYRDTVGYNQSSTFDIKEVNGGLQFIAVEGSQYEGYTIGIDHELEGGCENNYDPQGMFMMFNF